MTRTKLLLLILSAALALLPLQGAGQAGCRPIAVHHAKQQLVVGYTTAYPAQYYAVGQQLQLNAQEDRLAQKTAKLVLEQLRAQALQAPAEAVPSQPERMPLTAEVDRWANTKAFCASCHTTKEAAQAHIDMTSFAELTCEQKITAIRSMMDGKMPPQGAKQPTSEQLGQIIGEFVGAETVIQP